MKKLLIALLVLSWPAFQALQAQAGLVEADEKTLIFMAEEEKMARDFYQAMEAKWNVKVFNHTTAAEQRHFDKTVELATSQGVVMPEALTTGQAGKYQNEELQQLYDGLMASGNESLEAALRAGARLEEINIRDMKQALESTQSEAARTTYLYLLDASGNHLRAFNKNLAAQGITYEPVLLTQADFDAIIAAESGGQGCQGNKAQAGKGGCQGNKAEAGKGGCQGKGGNKGQCCQGGGKGKGRKALN